MSKDACAFAAFLLLAALSFTSCASNSSSTTGTQPGPGTPTAKTTPTITWAQPAAITYPAPLSSTQLDATANVPGTFSYNPPAGTVLNPGTQKLMTTFTPTNMAAYNNATASVSLKVNPQAAPPPNSKTTPTLTWPQPAAITNPAPLTSAELDATANVPGTFVYNPPTGTVLDPGNHTLSVAFTPTNTSAYNNANASVTLTVNPPTSSSPSDFVYFGGVGNMLSGLAIANNAVSTIPGSPFTVTNQAQSEFFLAGAGKFLFISGMSPGVIVTWMVNAQTGGITQTSSSTQPPRLGLGTDPSGKFLYGMNTSAYGFSIDHQTGDLSSLPGSPYSLEDAAGNPPQISPDGTWLCTAGFAGPGVTGNVFCAQRDPSTGAIMTNPSNEIVAGTGSLEGGGPFAQNNYLLANTLQFNSSDNTYTATGLAVLQISTAAVKTVNTYPGVHGEIAVDLTGTLVAVSGDNSNLTLFTFDGTNGTLTQKAQITLPQPPGALTFTCDSNDLAVSHPNQNTVSVYSVSNGTLQEIGGSPISVANGADQSVAACPGK